MSEIHEGGCTCGAVRYKTLAAPKRVSICACSWCQKRSGSAFGISVYFRKSDVEITGGPTQSKLCVARRKIIGLFNSL